MGAAKGTVYLVGAGPGDPGLATVRAMELVRSCDVLVYDALVSPAILEARRPDCELFYVGKRAAVHAVPQDKINETLVEWARAGRSVVRLKGGDPYIFGRGAEEGEFLYDRGVPFEVVPGITSVIAAPAYAGIPMSHRDFNSTITFITGHEKPEKIESTIPWDLLASGKATLGILMGVENLEHNLAMLRSHGLPGTTPVALVRWGTTPDQQTVVGTAETVVDEVRKAGLKAPAITVVGEVVRLREKLRWFERRPLFGRRVVVTRAREQASGFAARLRELGAEPIEFPTIAVSPPASWDSLDAALKDAGGYDWLIFTSANGVRFTVERLAALGLDVRDLRGPRICCIGPETARAVESYGMRVSLVPSEFRAEAITPGLGEIAGRRFLIARAREAREVLPDALREMGGEVTVAVAYETTVPKDRAAEMEERFRRGEIDCVSFTSSSTAKNFAGMFADAAALLKGVVVASIGPITAETARGLGFETKIMPKDYTTAALADAIADYYAKERD